MHRTTKKLEECGPCPVFAGFTLAFALQLRKKHRKTSVKVVIHKHTMRIHSHNIKNCEIFIENSKKKLDIAVLKLQFLYELFYLPYFVYRNPLGTILIKT
jgi:hypothetical protein